MIDALARPTATLRSKLLRHIPAPQTTSGFAEVRHKTITYRTVKCECRSLWQEHSAERECAKAERRAGCQRRPRSDTQVPARIGVVFTLRRINLIHCRIYRVFPLRSLRRRVKLKRARQCCLQVTFILVSPFPT